MRLLSGARWWSGLGGAALLLAATLPAPAQPPAAQPADSGAVFASPAASHKRPNGLFGRLRQRHSEPHPYSSLPDEIPTEEATPDSALIESQAPDDIEPATATRAAVETPQRRRGLFQRVLQRPARARQSILSDDSDESIDEPDAVDDWDDSEAEDGEDEAADEREEPADDETVEPEEASEEGSEDAEEESEPDLLPEEAELEEGFWDNCLPAAPLSACKFCPFIFSRGEALWLHRSNAARVFLGEEQIIPASTVAAVLTTDAAEFDYESGFRVLTGIQLSEAVSLEGLYFGTHFWSESGLLVNTDPAANGLFSNYLSLAGAFADAYAFTYTSTLHNAEINLRSGRRGDVWAASVLGGVRYLNLSETFTLSGVSSIFGLSEATQATTSNNLVGFQVGGAVGRGFGERLGFTASGKAGLYMNFAEEHLTNSLTAPPAGTIVPLDARASGASGAGSVEAGLFLTYRLFDNITLRGGYEVFFFDRLALAPEQLGSLNNDLAKVPQTINPGVTGAYLNDRGSAIFQGPSAGIQVRW